MAENLNRKFSPRTLVDFVLSTALLISGLSLIFSDKKDKNTDSQLLVQNKIQLPNFLEIELNNQSQIFLVQPLKKPLNKIQELIHDQASDFSELTSDVYHSKYFNLSLVFFRTTKNDHYFALLKEHNNVYSLQSIYLVNSFGKSKIETAYGNIKFLSQEEFYNKALKLAEVNDEFLN